MIEDFAWIKVLVQTEIQGYFSDFLSVRLCIVILLYVKGYTLIAIEQFIHSTIQHFFAATQRKNKVAQRFITQCGAKVNAKFR